MRYFDGGCLLAIWFFALSPEQWAVTLGIIGAILYIVNQTLQIISNIQKRKNDKS